MVIRHEIGTLVCTSVILRKVLLTALHSHCQYLILESGQGDGSGAAPDHPGGQQGGHGEEQEGEGQPRQGARHPLQHQVH